VRLLLSDLVRTPGGRFDPSKVVLELDGSDVTGLAAVSETLVQPASAATMLFQPTSDLALGSHHAAFTYPTGVGSTTLGWDFTAANIGCEGALATPTGTANTSISEGLRAQATTAAQGSQGERSPSTAAAAAAPSSTQTALPRRAVEIPMQLFRGIPHPGLYRLMVGSAP
jgi:hypothetical protein